MTYTLTKIKSFLGNEGHGLNATICCDDKPIAFVLDDANGGAIQIDFRNPLQTAASYEANKATSAAAEAACLAWALNWLRTDPGAERVRQQNAELAASYGSGAETTELQQSWSALEDWVNTTADDLLLAKKQAAQLNRWAKTQTVFRLKGDPAGEYRTVGKPVQTPGVVAALTQKYGDQIEMIHGVDLSTMKMAA